MGFIVIGVIALLAGAFILYMRSERIKGCQPYIAKVINIEEKVAVSGHIIKKMYRPVVSYNGRREGERAHYHTYVDFYNLKLKIGDELTIYADPRMPGVFYFSTDVNGTVSLGAVLAFAVGALFIASGIIIMNGGLKF